MSDDSFTHQVTLRYGGNPVGTLRLDGVSESYLASAALVPAVICKIDGSEPKVMSWAIVPRTQIDTRLQLGETSPFEGESAGQHPRPKETRMGNYQGPGRYRHYKGGEYEVLGLALREDSIDKNGVVKPSEVDGSQFVIYRPLTVGSLLERRREDFWARDLDDFDAMVSREHGQVPRFVLEKI